MGVFEAPQELHTPCRVGLRRITIESLLNAGLSGFQEVSRLGCLLLIPMTSSNHNLPVSTELDGFSGLGGRTCTPSSNVNTASQDHQKHHTWPRRKLVRKARIRTPFPPRSKRCWGCSVARPMPPGATWNDANPFFCCRRLHTIYVLWYLVVWCCLATLFFIQPAFRRSRGWLVLEGLR